MKFLFSRGGGGIFSKFSHPGERGILFDILRGDVCTREIG